MNRATAETTTLASLLETARQSPIVNSDQYYELEGMYQDVIYRLEQLHQMPYADDIRESVRNCAVAFVSTISPMLFASVEPITRCAEAGYPGAGDRLRALYTQNINAAQEYIRSI